MDSFNSLSLDDSPRQKLYRSMSFSEISPRKEIKTAQNVVSGPFGKAVLRQYSCNELGVVPGTSSLRYSQKFVSELHVDLTGVNSSDILSKKNWLDNQFELNKFINRDKQTKRQAMEAGPSKKVDMHRKRSHDSDSTEDFQNRKMFKSSPIPCNKLQNRQSELKPNASGDIENADHPRTITQLLFVVFVPLLLAALATFVSQYAAYQKMCETSLDVTALDHSLSSHIFGQKKAVRSIIENFKNFNSSDHNRLHVMVLTGPTGVGKTYTASLLEEIFPWKHNIHHFIMPIDFEKLSEHSLQSYPYCGDHFVILDDLRIEDIKDVAYIVSYLTRLAEKNKVIALLIFKFHKQLSGHVPENELLEMSNEVQKNLIERGINDCIKVDFKALEENDVVLCIKEALARHWIPISDHAIDTILHQVDYRSEGCKRISSKIALVNELWVRER